MFTRISFTRLHVGSIYKLVFVGLLCTLLPLSTFFGVLSAFGFDTIRWNGQVVHGFSGLLLGPLIGAILTAGFAIFLGTACVVGLWLFSKFGSLSVWAKNVVHHADEIA